MDAVKSQLLYTVSEIKMSNTFIKSFILSSVSEALFENTKCTVLSTIEGVNINITKHSYLVWHGDYGHPKLQKINSNYPVHAYITAGCFMLPDILAFNLIMLCPLKNGIHQLNRLLPGNSTDPISSDTCILNYLCQRECIVCYRYFLLPKQSTCCICSLDILECFVFECKAKPNKDKLIVQ